MRSKRPGFIGSLMIIVGGLLLFVSGFYFHDSQTPYPDGISATATITDIHAGRNSRGRLMYSAIYTFTAADGHPVSFQDPASASNRPDVGATVEVSYRAAHPEQARRVPAVGWFSWIIVAVGALVVISGLGHLIGNLRRLNR
ncbi:DUF3592 domain-containing protein [Actinoplanes sp. NPDC051470]|uniref:DUF3592 domain-containing protein n=1 Tax=unclassified Actinoplanes TaxID=2626549 RepID=UPI00342A937A